MFYLLVTKFNYISSKGEGNFGPRTRKFEELTRNWKTDIEVDEEKKRGLVIQTTASQTVSYIGKKTKGTYTKSCSLLICTSNSTPTMHLQA
jgi:hypothetical protein